MKKRDTQLGGGGQPPIELLVGGGGQPPLL